MMCDLLHYEKIIDIGWGQGFQAQIFSSSEEGTTTLKSNFLELSGNNYENNLELRESMTSGH